MDDCSFNLFDTLDDCNLDFLGEDRNDGEAFGLQFPAPFETDDTQSVDLDNPQPDPNNPLDLQGGALDTSGLSNWLMADMPFDTLPDVEFRNFTNPPAATSPPFSFDLAGLDDLGVQFDEEPDLRALPGVHVDKGRGGEVLNNVGPSHQNVSHAPNFAPNTKVGGIAFWQREGMQISDGYTSPGAFGTHSWVMMNPAVAMMGQKSDVTCTLCSFIFKPADFTAHMKSYHKADDKLMVHCFACEQLVMASLFNLHLTSVHRISPTLTKSAWLPFGIRRDEMTRMVKIFRRNQCCECEGKPHFATSADLNRHIKFSHTQEDLVFSCSRCASTFRTQIALANHMHKIHDHAGWVCQLCHHAFKHKRTMKEHMDRDHGGLSNKHCHRCDRSYHFTTDYVRHVKDDHAGVGRFICTVCGTTFNRHTTYREHTCQLTL